MTIAQSRARTLLSALSAVALIAFYAACGSSDVTTNREGGTTIPQAGSGAVDSDAPVPWCAAYHIVNCVCQQCHQNPPVNGAPIPLLTYDDMQAAVPGSSMKVWQLAQNYVSTRFMPFTGDKTVMPPVQPLNDEDYNTMLSWFAQGATDLGGQDCPMTCDWTKGPPSQ